jgi:trimeric autotransporter adhesin
VIGVNNITVKNLTISNYYEGIRITNSSGNTLHGKNITGIHTYAILIRDSDNNTISKNNLVYNLVGLRMWSSVNTTISENSIENNTDGLYLYSSDDSSISNDNKIYHNNARASSTETKR